jgi:hypothetical protein
MDKRPIAGTANPGTFHKAGGRSAHDYKENGRGAGSAL